MLDNEDYNRNDFDFLNFIYPEKFYCKMFISVCKSLLLWWIKTIIFCKNWGSLAALVDFL